MKDAPNFAAWNIETLAKFAQDSHTRNQQAARQMQEQEETIAQYQRDLKVAMAEIRRLILLLN
jgi:hypothetical protein